MTGKMNISIVIKQQESIISTNDCSVSHNFRNNLIIKIAVY
jgi:hypothetical protein